jgi:2,4-dienoyl-CoA reductase-like NADH-dependent reductase (Old Yellow Enzyme family)
VSNPPLEPFSSTLLTPIRIGGAQVRNRAWVSPMCQYSCTERDGLPGAWHEVHYGALTTGGFGLVVTEASAVVPEGRISPEDAGVWSDAHVDAWRPIVDFAHAHGTGMVMQLAHAGRKASTYSELVDRRGTVPLDEGGWETVGPSVNAFGDLAPSRAMTTDEIRALPAYFAAAAQRAVAAGFDGVEIHAAHGYLLHEFLSPLINERDDEYGGDLDGRARLLRETVRATRAALPSSAILMVRISATDWAPGGWDLEQSTALAERLLDLGVDLLDVSSGGGVAHQEIPVGPRYQVDLAAAIRRDTGIPTGAVGLIQRPEDAETIVAAGEADVVLLGRAALQDPKWGIHAAIVLGGDPTAAPWPLQYRRAALVPVR